MSFRSLGTLLSASLAFALLSARPAAAEDIPAAASNDLARTKLRELFTAADGTVRAPQSPRFVALREPRRPGTTILIGWAFPGAISGDDRAALLQLTSLLGPSDSRLVRRLTAVEPSASVETTLDEVGGVPLLVIAVRSARGGLDRKLEPLIVDAALGLGIDGTPWAAQLARRYLRPLARCVVELDSGADVRDRKSSRPKLYVAKVGDTLAKVARHFGVSEKALMALNRLEAGTLTTGQKLVLPP